MPDSAASSCLTGLVGLSRAASPCFPLPAPPADTAFITESSARLYLDEVEGLHLRPAPNQTAGTDAWARFDRARSQAITHVDNDLSKRVALGAPVTLPAGTLGGLGSGQLALVGTEASLTLPLTLRPGLAWRLVGVQLYTDIVVTDVPVYLDTVRVGTLTMNGGVFTPADGEPILLPFDGLPYTLRAELPAGVRPRQNALTCGCGNEWVRSVSSSLAPGSNVKMPASGFVLQVQTVCTAGKPLCHAISQDEELRRSVAFAVQYKTAEFTVVGLLSEASYSRYTSLDVKALEGLIARYSALAAEHLDWLSGPTGLTRVPHPCYCAAPTGFFSYTKGR